MTIVKKEDLNRGVEIDLTGPDGNVFVLIGIAIKFAKQLNLNHKEIVDEIISGDYDHAVEVFDKHFGEFVTLLR